MKQKFSKVLLSSVALGLVGGLYADSTQAQSSSDDSMQSRVITPNAGPRVTNGADVFLTADFIYWTARQDGLAYTRTGILDPADALAGVAVNSGTTQFTPGKFDPGFKVGIGLDLGHDGWDVYLNYTWFQANHTNSNTTSVSDVHSATAQPQRPLWDVALVDSIRTDLDALDVLGYETAAGRWRIHFNNFDLELGRNYYISQYLTMRPHVGFKGTWQSQQYRVYYTTPVSVDVVSWEAAGMKINQDYWGVGIRTGLDTAWYFTKNWCFFNETALSLLWGQFETSRKDYLYDITATTTTPFQVVNTAQNFHTVKPVFETTFGIRFDYWFSDDNYHFGIDAAWEEQLWLNQNQFFKLFDGLANHGDLSFQGLTLRLRFDF